MIMRKFGQNILKIRFKYCYFLGIKKDKKTVFSITFFLLSLVILFMACGDAPENIAGPKFQTPAPKTVEIGGLNFTFAAGYFEDNDSQEINLANNVVAHVVNKSQKSFKQNEILLLDIAVLKLDGKIDLNDLNDGTYENKSINGVEGIFKSGEATTSAGWVKNSHPRYYFNYLKDDNLVMIQCDNLRTIEEMVS